MNCGFFFVRTEHPAAVVKKFRETNVNVSVKKNLYILFVVSNLARILFNFTCFSKTIEQQSVIMRIVITPVISAFYDVKGDVPENNLFGITDIICKFYTLYRIKLDSKEIIPNALDEVNGRFYALGFSLAPASHATVMRASAVVCFAITLVPVVTNRCWLPT